MSAISAGSKPAGVQCILDEDHMNTMISNSGAARLSLPAGRIAIGASAAALMLLASLHVLSPEFDPSWRMVSEYANGR